MDGKKGTLYLVPNLLDPDSAPEAALPAAALARVGILRRFIAEGDKAAWRLLSRVLDPEAARAVSMERLDEHTPLDSLPALIAPLDAGEDVGLISEAGMPCVADPGAALVALAHDRGIRVQGFAGPSSILLALAASGLDGQRFAFLGYLPPDRESRRASLQRIDRGIRAEGATRIFIETPYRNDRLLEDCLDCLSPDARLCVAASLCSAAEKIRSAPVSEWRRKPWAPGKVPAVFLAGQVPGTSLGQRRFDGHSDIGCKNRKF